MVLSPVDGKSYADACGAADVALRVVPESMSTSLAEIARDASSANPSKVLQAVLDELFTPYVDEMYEAALASAAESDVVIGGSSSWYAKAAALKTKKPFVVVDYYPVVPSRTVPPPGLANWGWLNSMRWAALNVMLDMAFRKAPAEFFAKHGLPPIRHAVPDVVHSDVLNLHAASPTLCPQAPDWSSTHHVCGEFIVGDRLEVWRPSQPLQTFLDEGEPPVLFSLGSMEHMAPERARRLVDEAATASGVRSIVQSKHPTMAEGRDGDVYFLPWAPHRRLLPLCRAMVHHGGAGTTHAALRAGKPSIVVPFIMEQQLWARRLAELGAAPPFESFWKTTPARLSEIVKRLVQSSEMSARAAQLGAKMNAEESGVEVAARLLLAALALQ